MSGMIEIVGDLWEEHEGGSVVAITTGGLVDRHGRAAMPRGCARQAAKRFPALRNLLGGLLRARGNHVYDLGGGLVSFPVEGSPYEMPDPRIIERSCRELVELTGRSGWLRVVVPRPGCGGGGLEWEAVGPFLDRYFDQRFLVITRE